MQRAAILLTCLMVSACAATGPAFTPVAPVDGKAIVYVYRMYKDDGLSARDAHFYFDDRHAFDLSPNGYSYIALAPGRHTLREEWSWDVVGGRTITFPVIVKAGETHYYRLVVLSDNNDNTIGWRWFIREDAPSAGETEISTKHFQAPDK